MSRLFLGRRGPSPAPLGEPCPQTLVKLIHHIPLPPLHFEPQLAPLATFSVCSTAYHRASVWRTELFSLPPPPPRCLGNETSLDECVTVLNRELDHSGDVGVECHRPELCTAASYTTTLVRAIIIHISKLGTVLVDYFIVYITNSIEKATKYLYCEAKCASLCFVQYNLLIMKMHALCPTHTPCMLLEF